MSLYPIRFNFFALTACAALFGIIPSWGHACETRYFSDSDYLRQTPLARPTREFSTLYSAAKSGNAQAQRSLAVAYEAGYLVSACEEKAAYWYEKAAAAGDAFAQDWMSRHKTFNALFSGPECVGDQCSDGNQTENHTAILYANNHKREHYFAPVTINGHTVEGLIDTGASNVAMSYETARKLEITTLGGKNGLSATAAGNIPTTEIVVPLIDVSGVKLRNVRVTVGISGQTLIGMSFLSRVDMTMGTGVLAMKKH